MRHFDFSHILNPIQYLSVEFDCRLLSQLLALDDVIEQFTSLCILHNEVQFRISFYDFIQLDEVWMSDHFENLDFSSDPLNVALVFNFILF